MSRRRNLTAPAALAQTNSNQDFPQAPGYPGVSKMISLWPGVSEWCNSHDSARALRDAKREEGRLTKIAKAEEWLADLQAEVEAENTATAK